MPEITLQPNEVQVIPISGRWLSIISATGSFQVYGLGFSPLTGKIGRKFELPDHTEVNFKNRGAEAITIDYETSNIRVDGDGGGVVEVGNAITVKTIQEGINVTANATVNDGSIKSLVADNTNLDNDLVIAPDSTLEVFPARNAPNRVVTIQVISAQDTECRVGNIASMTATQGKLIKGSIDNVASIQIANTGAIYVRNNGSTDATITRTEEYS